MKGIPTAQYLTWYGRQYLKGSWKQFPRFDHYTSII
jgi:hypothetical protein